MNHLTARCPCGTIVQLPNLKARATSAKCGACISRARAQAHPGVRDLAMFEVKEHTKRSDAAGRAAARARRDALDLPQTVPVTSNKLMAFPEIKPYSPPPSVWAGVRVSMAGDGVTITPPLGCTLQFGYDHDRCTDRVKLSAYDCGQLVGETRVDCRLLRRTTHPGYLLAEEPRKAFSDLRYSKSELGFEEPAGLEDDE
jgi:hypothetical protein